MLKIVHLIAGACALALSFVPALQGSELPYLQQADALSLALLGLLNLALAAQQLPARPASNQHATSSLLLLAASLIQALGVLVPSLNVANQPLTLLSLPLATVSLLLNLLPARQAAPRRAASASEFVPSNDPNRENGTVKWFNTSKGFGFISRDCGEDIFVHFRAIRGEGHRILVEGQRVEFSVIQRDKGLQAEDVVIALSH